METQTDIPVSSAVSEVSRLVAMARQLGEADVYIGKRRWIRYSLGMPLEVTLAGVGMPGLPASWSVITHNVSGGGVGFWSKHPIAQHTAIRIRECSDGREGEWIQAHVSHCTLGIRGYLIGARLDHPAPTDAASETAGQVGMAGASADGVGGTSLFVSPLWVRCAWVSATVSAAGVLAAIQICRSLWGEQWSAFLPATAVALSFTLAAVGGWISTRSEGRFLQAFRRAMRNMSKGGETISLLPKAPSEDLAALRQVFVNLEVMWRKREDEERAQRHKLEELTQIKSNILSIVSHDLRTPLTSILLYAQMLMDDMETLGAQDQRHFLGIITEECTRLSRLLDDLLHVQRLEGGRDEWHMRPMDLSDTIRACARLHEAMAQSKGIEFRMECPDSLPTVEAEPDKITQVLSNLLSNALKFTPNGGAVQLLVRENVNTIVLSVADTGPGIPRDKWDQIFDRFTQLPTNGARSTEGVGLGLHIVRKIVERHGGAVWVDSEAGRGSEFSVSLPVVTAVDRKEEESAPAAKRVLVCDADPELAAMIAQTLRRDRYDVRIAHSGCRLLAQLTQGDTDVVVTDVMLPDMAASDLLDALDKGSDRPYRIVVHSYASDGPDLRRRGVDVILHRPASKDELLQAVRVALQKRLNLGQSILLVGIDDGDMPLFKRLLADAGHMSVPVGDLHSGLKLIRDYAIDAALVSADLLKEDWSEVETLRQAAEVGVDIVVLCDHVGKKERQLAALRGVRALAYHVGREDEVVAALLPILDVQETGVGQ